MWAIRKRELGNRRLTERVGARVESFEVGFIDSLLLPALLLAAIAYTMVVSTACVPSVL